MEDDSEFAFNLQVEEALTESLLDGAASSPDTASVPYDAVFGASLSNLLQSDHLYKYEKELLDMYNGEAKAKRLRLDLNRQIHDRAFACEILNVPEEEWIRTGDHLIRPYGEGSSAAAESSSSSCGQVLEFRVYVKGLVGETVGGIGVAIFDGNRNLVFELGKVFSWKDAQAKSNEDFADLKALTEGLDVAVTLGLNRITIVTDSQLLYQYVTGKNPQMIANVATLSNQINLLLRKFTHTRASFVASKDMESAVELARNAMVSNLNSSQGNGNANNSTESCTICLENTSVDQMFRIEGCLHSYCFSCMSKHVQFKLLEGILPKCPHENCKSELKLDSCKNFMTPELSEIMSQRLKEASIPPSEKIYCPYAKCSTLLSQSELKEYMSNSAAKCPRCSGVFCINCKVPWHCNMSCSDFKRLNPYPSEEDKKLKSLAARNLWRQCPKCKNMVSLAVGCYHIYCRCGHEFCYTCGARWENKKATCTCPIWDERNIEYE